MNQSVSVIVALYNGEKHIVEALDSVLRQNFPPKEVLIIDDGSTDSSLAVVQQYIRQQAIAGVNFKIISQNNEGQSSARNRGLIEAQGNLVAFLDQDDVWEPHHLLESCIAFDEQTNLGWTYSDFNVCDDEGKIIQKEKLKSTNYRLPKMQLLDLISRDLMMLPSASVIKSSALSEVGGFDPQFIGYEDDDLFLRIYLAGYGFKFLPRSSIIYRVHSSNSSGNESFSRSRKRFFSKYYEFFLRNYPESPELIWQGLAPRMTSATLHEVFVAGKNSNEHGREDALVWLKEIFDLRGWTLKRRIIFIVASQWWLFNPAYRALLKLRAMSNRFLTEYAKSS